MKLCHDITRSGPVFLDSVHEVKRNAHDKPVSLTVGQSAVLDVLWVNDVCQVDVTRATWRRRVCHAGPVQIVDDPGRVRHQRHRHERKPDTSQELGRDRSRRSFKPCSRARYAINASAAWAQAAQWQPELLKNFIGKCNNPNLAVFFVWVTP